MRLRPQRLDVLGQIQFVPPPQGPLTGRRVRWADLSGDGVVDLVVSGGHNAFWNGGFASYPIVPFADGYLGDFALADLDGDLDLDLLAAFLDGGGVRVYRRGARGFTADPASIGPDARTVELCELDGDGARDVLLVEADRLAAFALDDGLGAALMPDVLGAYADATCGDLDGDGHDEIVATQAGGPVVIVDHLGQIAWAAPEALAGAGVDTGDLDGDGDIDLVISETGADARVHVYWNRGETPLAFDHLVGPILGDDLGRLDLTYLGGPLPP